MKSIDKNQAIDDKYDKMAKLSAIDFMNRSIVLFKGNKLISCDSSDKKDIDHIQYKLSKCIWLFCFVYKKKKKKCQNTSCY